MTTKSWKPRDARDRLIVALDVPTVEEARSVVANACDAVTFYKIGMQLVFAGGLNLIPSLLAADKRIFLDMKLLDIDNTVAMGAESIDRLGVTLTTIHAYPQAMRAAVKANPDRSVGLLGVTVLTSMNDADLVETGYRDSISTLVAERARDAKAAEMDGIICSPAEAETVRRIVGPDMLIVTPGVRPAGSDAGDQKRVKRPAEAIQSGADYIVVGRPVTGAESPARAAEAIVQEITEALFEGVS